MKVAMPDTYYIQYVVPQQLNRAVTEQLREYVCGVFVPTDADTFKGCYTRSREAGKPGDHDAQGSDQGTNLI